MEKDTVRETGGDKHGNQYVSNPGWQTDFSKRYGKQRVKIVVKSVNEKDKNQNNIKAIWAFKYRSIQSM